MEHHIMVIYKKNINSIELEDHIQSNQRTKR